MIGRDPWKFKRLIDKKRRKNSEVPYEGPDVGIRVYINSSPYLSHLAIMGGNKSYFLDNYVTTTSEYTMLSNIL